MNALFDQQQIGLIIQALTVRQRPLYPARFLHLRRAQIVSGRILPNGLPLFVRLIRPYTRQGNGRCLFKGHPAVDGNPHLDVHSRSFKGIVFHHQGIGAGLRHLKLPLAPIADIL